MWEWGEALGGDECMKLQNYEKCQRKWKDFLFCYLLSMKWKCDCLVCLLWHIPKLNGKKFRMGLDFVQWELIGSLDCFLFAVVIFDWRLWGLIRTFSAYVMDRQKMSWGRCGQSSRCKGNGEERRYLWRAWGTLCSYLKQFEHKTWVVERLLMTCSSLTVHHVSALFSFKVTDFHSYC